MNNAIINNSVKITFFDQLMHQEYEIQSITEWLFIKVPMSMKSAVR
jgi:hypothetical protein